MTDEDLLKCMTAEQLRAEIRRLRAENARLREACKAARHTDYFGCDCYSCAVLRAAIEGKGS